VQGFEPDPALFQILESNVHCVGLEDVEIENSAIWDEDGPFEFVSDGADTGRIAKNAASTQVQAIRLASRNAEPVDLLKLDNEGAEYRVLADLMAIGSIRHVKRLICEVHSRRDEFAQLGPLLVDLANNGFQFTFNHARTARDLPGESWPTPFPAATDGKALLHLYAWSPSACTS
jgi:FkbM family methyltransferase